MKICFVPKEGLSDFWDRTGGVEADVIFFPLFEDTIVSYEKELRGETNYFEDVALLSKACKNVVVCGYSTSTRGIVRASAVVAENGRILGVSDALANIDDKRNGGAFLKVYETSAGRIGIAVAEDLYFTEVFRTLAVCGSDVALCPCSSAASGAETVLLRAAAFSYGMPACLCSRGYACVADTNGETAFSSPCSPSFYSVERGGEFHLVEWRQRGLVRRSHGTY